MNGGWGRLRGLSLMVLVAGAACATLPPCPDHGGPVWRELTSAHFVLRSDLPPSDATEVLRTLEETRAGMLAAVWPGDPGPPGRIQAIALSSQRELAVYTGPLVAGVHLRHPPFPATLVLGAADTAQSAAKHELAHELAFYFLPAQPPWYAEGVASFLQTIRYDRGTGRSSVGEPEEGLYRYFRGGGPLELEALLGRMPTDPLARQRFYATSWLLTHYLRNKRPQGWEALRRRLEHLEPGAQAFRAEFPDLDGDGLQGTLVDYLNGGAYTVERYQVAPWNETPRARTMADVEVHGVRAFLFWSMRSLNDEITVADVEGQLQEGLRGEQPSLDALAVAYYGPNSGAPGLRAELATRALHAHPQAWLSWMMSADLRPRALPARRADLLRALGLAPDEPELLIRLASADAEEGLWDDAFALTNRVLGAGALHPQLWILHVAALRETGHCAESERWAAVISAYLPVEGGPSIDAAARRPCGRGPRGN